VVLDSRTFADGVMLILEIKEYEDDQDRAKHQATQQ
jgi:hypothetical protein